jgi:NADH pyrophosphatase NudC (nudix superfamily)
VGYVVVTVLALLAGFAAGFAVFKRSERWCPGCGSLMTETHCSHWYPHAAMPTPEAAHRS